MPLPYLTQYPPLPCAIALVSHAFCCFGSPEPTPSDCFIGFWFRNLRFPNVLLICWLRNQHIPSMLLVLGSQTYIFLVFYWFLAPEPTFFTAFYWFLAPELTFSLRFIGFGLGTYVFDNMLLFFWLRDLRFSYRFIGFCFRNVLLRSVSLVFRSGTHVFLAFH